MLRLFAHVSFFLYLLLLSFVAQAKASSLQHDRSRYLKITGNGNRIYLFKNISKRPVILDRYQRVNPGASAGWGSSIRPGNWSAIFLDFSHFSLICKSKNQHGYWRTVDCKNVLKVWPIQKFSMMNKKTSNFWIAEDMSCPAIQKRVRARGFYFKFPTCSY